MTYQHSTWRVVFQASVPTTSPSLQQHSLTQLVLIVTAALANFLFLSPFLASASSHTLIGDLSKFRPRKSMQHCSLITAFEIPGTQSQLPHPCTASFVKNSGASSVQHQGSSSRYCLSQPHKRTRPSKSLTLA